MFKMFYPSTWVKCTTWTIWISKCLARPLHGHRSVPHRRVLPKNQMLMILVVSFSVNGNAGVQSRLRQTALTMDAAIAGRKDAGTLIVTLRSFKNCFFEFLSPGHEHYTLAQQFHSFMGKQANIFVSLADESWVYSWLFVLSVHQDACVGTIRNSRMKTSECLRSLKWYK